MHMHLIGFPSPTSHLEHYPEPHEPFNVKKVLSIFTKDKRHEKPGLAETSFTVPSV